MFISSERGRQSLHLTIFLRCWACLRYLVTCLMPINSCSCLGLHQFCIKLARKFTHGLCKGHVRSYWMQRRGYFPVLFMQHLDVAVLATPAVLQFMQGPSLPDWGSWLGRELWWSCGSSITVGPLKMWLRPSLSTISPCDPNPNFTAQKQGRVWVYWFDFGTAFVCMWCVCACVHVPVLVCLQLNKAWVAKNVEEQQRKTRWNSVHTKKCVKKVAFLNPLSSCITGLPFYWKKAAYKLV
jgi:hypothetical protein